MLFTDSDIVTAPMLRQIDSETDAVAMATKGGIKIDGPGSICEQAWREGAQRINSAQQLYNTYLSSPGVSGGHLSAVQNVGVPPRAQPRVRLNQIVAHDFNYANSLSAVQIWLAYTALWMIFRDAAARLGKDRYEEKYERYKADADRHWRELRAGGLPMIDVPMEAPGAKHGFNAGAWSISNLSSTAGGTDAAQRVLVAITWYDSSRYVSPSNTGNGESGPSAVISFPIPVNTRLTVSIAGLNPPTGAQDQVGTAAGVWVPLRATHWQIYVGTDQTDPAVTPLLYLQQAVPIGTTSYTLTTAPAFSGSTLMQGQFADRNLVFQNIVGRG